VPQVVLYLLDVATDPFQRVRRLVRARRCLVVAQVGIIPVRAAIGTGRGQAAGPTRGATGHDLAAHLITEARGGAPAGAIRTVAVAGHGAVALRVGGDGRKKQSTSDHRHQTSHLLCPCSRSGRNNCEAGACRAEDSVDRAPTPLSSHRAEL
jgi:hypothetical protein